MIAPRPTPGLVYPDSDGKPMADNTVQFRWIVTIEGNLEALFRDRADVFVAGDHLWYPTEGHPEIRTAPDAYVVFGRPKGDRGSYKQWEENDVPLTVVFEILSPGNTDQEMAEKLQFYDEHGVQEYYLYDPDRDKLTAYHRGRATLRKVPLRDKALVSPLLGIRFDLTGDEMAIYHPNGKRFLTMEQLEAAATAAESRADKAESRADKAENTLARMAHLTQKVLSQQATPEELAELQHLARQAPNAAVTLPIHRRPFR